MLRPSKDVVIDLSDQGSEEWKRARLGKLSGSKAGDLMIKSKSGQPYAARANYLTQLALERITGELTETMTTAVMQEGIDREPVAALAYEFQTGNELAETGFWCKDYWGGSPDRLLVGQNGGVEIKNPMASTHYNTLSTGEIPLYYYWQMLTYMLITGAEFWDYVSYHPAFPENAQLFIKRVERKDIGEDLLALRTELSQANIEVEALVENINNYKGVAA